MLIDVSNKVSQMIKKENLYKIGLLHNQPQNMNNILLLISKTGLNL
jgi:hypothetical protein